MIFVDFETDGLNGPVFELAVVRDGVIICKSNSLSDIEPFLGKEFVIFWHYFMPSYIEKYFPKLFEKMRGKFICFLNIAFYNTGKFKIEDVTKEILGRSHKGNAIQDALDLYQCYTAKKEAQKMQTDDEVNKKLNELATIIKKKRDLSKPGSENKSYYRNLSRRLDYLRKCIDDDAKLSKQEDDK